MSHADFMRLIHPANPFELIDSPWGQIETWRASALACGTMGCLTEVYAHVKNDAAELQAKEQALTSRDDATVALARDVVAKIDAISQRITRLEAAQEQREQEAKVDAQRELEDLETIELPPDIEQLGEGDPTDDDTPGPSGELHSHPPTTPRHEAELAAREKDDDILDAEGDLPNELLQEAPPSGGTMPTPNPEDLEHPPTATPRPTVAPSFW